MKTKILCLLLAIVVYAGMLAAASHAGVPELWFFEIQARGKGVESVTEVVGPPAVYTEIKHTLNLTKRLYAMYNRSSRVLFFALYSESLSTWIRGTEPSVIETGKSVFPIIVNMIPIYAEDVGTDDAPINASGAIQIQFKEKDGVVKSAKLKSLGMSYYQAFSPSPAQSTYRFGTLKMKGKKIDRADVPAAVLTAFSM
jgi:hypothetical protein